MAEPGSNSRFNALTVTLIGGLIALLGLQIYTSSGLSSAESEIEALRATQEAEREELAAEIHRLEQEAERAGERQKQQAKMIEELETRASSNQQGVRALRADSTEAETAIENLRASQNQAERRATEADQQLARQVASLEESAEAAESGLMQVSGDLTELRNQAATKAELSATAEEVDQLTGQVSATQQQVSQQTGQLERLRQLADRDYLDFQLFRIEEPIEMGPVMVTVNSVDAVNQRLNLTLLVEGRTMQRPNLLVREPVEFLAGDSRVPYELVITRVEGNQAEGFLARPLEPADAEAP